MAAVMHAARPAATIANRNLTRAAAQNAFTGITQLRVNQIASALDIEPAAVRSKISLALSGDRAAFLELQGALS